MTGLTLLMLVLASFRLAHMIALEEGPFSVFLTFRDRVGQAEWWGRGLHCVLCLSFWLSLLLLWIWSQSNYYINSFIQGLAIAGGVLALHRGLLGGYSE